MQFNKIQISSNENQFNSTQLDVIQFKTFQSNSDPTKCNPIPIELDSTQFIPIQNNTIQFNTIRFTTDLSNSVQPNRHHLIQLNSIVMHFRSIQLSPIRVKASRVKPIPLQFHVSSSQSNSRHVQNDSIQIQFNCNTWHSINSNYMSTQFN